MCTPTPVAGSSSASPYQLDMEDDAMHELPLIKTRPPQPVRPGSPSLISLGSDITSLVIDKLRITDRRALFSVALVSSYYYELARYSRHSTVTLRLRNGEPKSVDPLGYGDRAEQAADLLRWLDRTNAGGLLPAIRRLEVNIDRNDDAKDPLGKQARDTLAAHMSHMSGLVDIYWRGDETLPDEVIQVLSERPGIHLHFVYRGEDPQRGDTGENPHKKTLSVLVGLANLRTLLVTSDYITSRQCQDIMQPVKDILLSCKELRRLIVDIRPRAGAHTPYTSANHTGPYTGFNFVHGERPAAALRVLRLINYTMRPEIVPLASSMGDIIAGQVEQNYWASTFDWSRLERLVVYDQFLALQMLPYLKSLRHVENTSRSRCFNHLVHEFFSQVPAGLVTISVAAIDTIGLDALLRHGSTLRKLRMHQSEINSEHVWQDQAVQESAMTQIRDTCVVLEELEVDIARAEGEWPYAMLDIIASFPRLRRLGLWFDVGLYDKENPVKPYLTASAARDICDYLLSRSSVTPSRMRSIIIRLGEPPEDKPWRYSHVKPKWTNASAVFRCRVSNRDDDVPPHTYEFEAYTGESQNPLGEEARIVPPRLIS